MKALDIFYRLRTLEAPTERAAEPGAEDAPKVGHRCSFCGRYSSEVGLMILGRGASICDGCVWPCVEICLKKLGKK